MNERILIIEEDKEIAELQKDYLEMNEFVVEIARSGEAGLKKAVADEFDMVLLEVKLSEIDGYEICKKIKEVKNIPVMFISEKDNEIDIIRGLGTGADDYMRKPFSPGEMVARVKAHLACYDKLLKVSEHQNDIMEIGSIRIDKTARRVFQNGAEKNFTTKEFDLLCFLMEHPNRVYTKEELFREIWDMESVGDIATVTVHIKKIREKLKEDSTHPKYVETIWGVGYRFKV